MGTKVDEGVIEEDTATDLADVLAETANSFADDGSGTIIEEDDNDGLGNETGEKDAGAVQAGSEESGLDVGEATSDSEKATETKNTDEKPKDDEPDFSFAEDEQYLKSLKETTRNRMVSLVTDRNKLKDQLAATETEITEKYTPAAQFREQWTGALQEAQMTQEDVNWMLTANRLMKTGKYDDTVQAAAMVDALKTQLDAQLGRTGTQGASVLDAHPDLVEKVNRYQISKEDAEQLAVLRNEQQVQARFRSHESEQTQQQNQSQQAFNEAANNITTMESQWQATDPSFKQKQPALVEYTNSLINEGVHPSRWPEMLTKEYDRINRLERTFKAPPAQATSNAPQAIRPTGSTARQAEEPPKDMNEALTREIERLRA